MSDPPAEEVEERPDPILFGNAKLSDLTLFVEDQDFVVHRMVLAAHSNVFSAMLYGGFKEAKEDRVEIKDVSIDTFKKILEILYYGRMSECEALNFNKITTVATGYKTYHHENGRSIENLEESYKKFWTFVNDLLAVADRFDVTEPTLICLEEEILKNICSEPECLVCLNLYLFALQKKIPILDNFHTFTKTNYKEWHAAVFKKDAPIEQQPFIMEPEQILTILDKFP